ncbi:MAG: hypothetical protein K2O67_02475, partial [Clostridia bacterium]|nr:hypothetical protein [Clostridia bacterium]
MEIFEFGNEDKSAEITSFKVSSKSGTSPGSSSSYSILNNHTAADKGVDATVTSKKVNYNNLDGTDSKEFIEYFGFYAYASGYTASAGTTQLNAALSFTSDYQAAPTKAVKVPAINAEFQNVEVNENRKYIDYNYITPYTGKLQQFTLQNVNSAITVKEDLIEVKEYGDTAYFTLTLKDDDCFWDDDGLVDEKYVNFGTRYVNIEVVKGEPVVVVNKIKACKLPDTVPIDTDKSSAGTIKWADDATIDNPKWVFVPTNPQNYNTQKLNGIAEVEKEHNFDNGYVAAVNPNCTTAGSKEYWQCSVCNKKFADSSGSTEIDNIYDPATGHSMSHITANAPTCTDAGNVEHYHCSVCKKNFNDSIGTTELNSIVDPATGHTSSDWKVDKAPTCTEAGDKHKECSVCHTTLETGTISSTGHDYSSEWTTDGSNHWHICANECGIKGSNAAHGFAWVIDKKATFTEAGKMHQKCETCNYETNFDTEIPMQTCAHDNAEHHAKVPATCSAEGTVEYKYCPDCQKNLNMEDVEISDLVIPVDPDNHVAYGEWATETAATCVSTGTEKRTCADCGNEDTRALAIDPNAHDLEHHEAKDPTCTEIGWNEYDTCKRSDCTYTTYSE